MITLIITPPVLTPGLTHDSTDWRILDNDNNVVWSSMGDEVNKTIIVANVALDPDKEYKAKARINFNKFTTEWSDVDIVKPKQLVDENNIDVRLPSTISVPEVTLQDVDITSVPNGFIKFKTSDFVSSANNNHDSTTWIIKDLYGKVYFISSLDRHNLTELFLDEAVLDDGKAYIVSAIHHSDSGDASQPGTLTFLVPKANLISLSKPIPDPVDRTSDLTIELNTIDGFNSLTYELFAVIADTTESILTDTSDTLSFTIKSDNWKDDINHYVLKITIDYDDDHKTQTKYFQIHVK